MIDSEQKEVIIRELMSNFLTRYGPAESWEDADEYRTSADIIQMFGSVYSLSADDIYKALHENDFKCVPLPDQTVFVWLLTLN